MKTQAVVSKTFFYVYFILTFTPGMLGAQKLALHGDTIFVNDQVPVTIEFPSSIYGEPQLVDPAAPYKLVKKLNSVFITALSKDVKPANAIISEGKRDHDIVLSYKQDIKPDIGDFYDLATPKKLEDFVKQSPARRKAPATTSATPQTDTLVVGKSVRDDNSVDPGALLNGADLAFNAGELEKADSLFTAVLAIDKGNDRAIKGKKDISLKRVEKNGKINEKQINNQYDSAMTHGSLALGQRNFVFALEKFMEAHRLKPLETLPSIQIEAIRNIFTQDSLQQVELQRRGIARVQEDVRQKRFKEGMGYYVSYESAAQIADMESEVYYLKKFLDIFPDYSELETNQYSTKIESAKKKISDIRSYWNRTRQNYQPLVDSIPYLAQEFESKYPTINFNVRKEQQFTVLDSIPVSEAVRITKELLKENPKFAFRDSINNVTVSCDAIKFIKEKAYYRIKIQNNDTTDFLMGTMAINHIKKDGATVKNYPDFISAFPIILPGKEFTIVYSAKDLDVQNEERLAFEINERLKKLKFTIPIPGNAYNEEKKFKLQL
jgi:hypothetical protein